jgi:hypothetical protein
MRKDKGSGKKTEKAAELAPKEHIWSGDERFLAL